MEHFSNDIWTFYTEISNSKPLSDLFSEVATIFTDAIKVATAFSVCCPETLNFRIESVDSF